MEHMDGEEYKERMTERALKAAGAGSFEDKDRWQGQDPYYPPGPFVQVKSSNTKMVPKPPETRHVPTQPIEAKKAKAPIADMLKDFHLAIERVALVTRYGNSQPGRSPGSWRDVPDFENEYRNAKARHAIGGLVEDNDRESGIEHLAHDAWNALALLQFKLEKRGESTGPGGW